MSISCTYVQKRRQLGKKCQFSNVGPVLLADIDPNTTLKSQYTEVPVIEKETQCLNEMSLHEVNTFMHPTKNSGMNHIMGGWPADVDPRDEDQVARFKKKIQKDESFINSIKKLGSLVENFVMENNSVDIFEEYFLNETAPDDTTNQFKALNVFRDYSEKKRKVLDLSWALDGCKLAAAHAVVELFADAGGLLRESYVWDIENSNLPYCVILPQGALTCVEYSPRDLELLLGGYANGQIGLWDVRAGGHPQQMTPLAKSHKESVTDLKWISSKTGSEFYSCSTDGKLICWDSRNLESDCQTLQFDLSFADNVEEVKRFGLTCLEYDPSSPHRFTLGTEQGVILSCNRKFKEVREIVTSCYSTHTVPVHSITRNAFFPKLFASCCAWDIKIWSEDLTVSPILNLRSQSGYCSDASWSPSHASFLFVTKTTGHLELWDILIKNHEPIVSFKLESDALTCVYTKQQGEQIVCGSSSGCIHLLNIPEYYASTTKQEKNLVAAMIDREGKREKFLEGKNRERKMREKFAGKNMEILNSPRGDILKNPRGEIPNSPRGEILSSPRGEIPNSPRGEILSSPRGEILNSPRGGDVFNSSRKGEITSDKTFNPEEKLEVVENGATEFISVFDPELKGDDDDVGETSTEKVLFDMQFCDVLNTILESVKQQ